MEGSSTHRVDTRFPVRATAPDSSGDHHCSRRLPLVGTLPRWSLPRLNWSSCLARFLGCGHLTVDVSVFSALKRSSGCSSFRRKCDLSCHAEWQCLRFRRSEGRVRSRLGVSLHRLEPLALKPRADLRRVARARGEEEPRTRRVVLDKTRSGTDEARTTVTSP